MNQSLHRDTGLYGMWYVPNSVTQLASHFTSLPYQLEQEEGDSSLW